ncbi:MAG: UDP-N-acetylmuramoyl-tripeptide--D-alanyl-D-alanine ligase [Clostridiales bacterium]|nr:UDP-N-acetylmuramoyl-tripeptide--D-alanyl-D-alanine ligase [Clostridiales bacterium]
MKNMTLEHIAAACGGTYYGNETDRTKEIMGAVIDSRLIEKDYLFIPIKGEKVDGHKFIPDVFEKGALAVLSEQVLEHPTGPYILVEDTKAAMKKLAEDYRKSLDIKVVGITGSVGKTSTKEMIASVLSQKYNVLKTEGNFNNEIGLPLTIFKIREQHEVAVLEMGISEFGEMHRLAQMANPDICVITNIGLCHLENLITRDGILKAKTESFEHLTPEGIAVLNGDDDKLCEKKMVNGKPAVFYGLGEAPKTSAPKQIYATEVEALGLTGTRAAIHIRNGNAPETKFTVEIPIAGEHNVYNALAAVAVARELGLTVEEMKRGIEAVQTIGGRSNLIHKNGMTIIDDCYNANPVSMKASIDVLSKAEGRKIAVLGDMGELGSDERKLHYSVGEYFKGKGIDDLFCAGELSREIAEAVKAHCKETRVHYFETKDALGEALKNYVASGDIILVKASHFMGFSEIVKELT